MNNPKSTIAIVLGIFIALVLISCKASHGITASAQANNTPVLHLTEADKGKTISVKKNQKIELTLRHPGDGGYSFNEPEINTSLLKLESHVHHAATKYAKPGDFGNDVWVFTPVGTGQADLTITASRSWEKGEKSPSFSAKLQIQ